MNTDQTKGIAERLVYAAVMAVLVKLVGKGYIDQDMAAYIAAGATTAVGGAWAWWINRPKALAQAAAAQKGFTVVTDAQTAHDTPETNIVSSATMKVVPK